VRVLLDNCVDVRFARLITGHEVVHARDVGWQELSNGKLLAAAEEAGFAVLITTDKNIRNQQNMAKKGMSLITLGPRLTEYDFIAPLAGQVAIELSRDLAPGCEILIKPNDK
jgi:hypothetical protein